MRVNIIAAGKVKDKNLLSLWEEYHKRFKLFKVTLKEIEEKNLTKNAINQKLLLATKPSYKIVLDEKGKEFNSNNFSEIFKNNHNEFSFIIGGADGITDEVKKNADMILSLSKLTLPHKLARIFLIEQLYRAETIINNHPYHRN